MYESSTVDEMWLGLAWSENPMVLMSNHELASNETIPTKQLENYNHENYKE